jgi:hypothetical protein
MILLFLIQIISYYFINLILAVLASLATNLGNKARKALALRITVLGGP